MENHSINQDVCTLPDFGANIKLFIEQVSKTKKPLVLTENGIEKAVLIDINKYQKLIDELELLKDIQIGEEQVKNGEYLSNEEARQQLLG